jgi:hypothetical protein
VLAAAVSLPLPLLSTASRCQKRCQTGAACGALLWCTMRGKRGCSDRTGAGRTAVLAACPFRACLQLQEHVCRGCSSSSSSMSAGHLAHHLKDEGEKGVH